ncbi:MAG: type II secretion system protein GspL, partial [Rhodoferax sp.]
IALVPGRALSWHPVQLPAGTLPRSRAPQRQAPRLRTVLEGLLEDRLLDEPAQLHFALQTPAPPDGPLWVAVCDRSWLRDALQALQQAGISPDRVVPEWVPGNQAATDLWVTGSPDAAQLVWTDEQGVHALPVAADQPLPRQVPDTLRTHATLHAEPAVAQRAEQLLHREANVVPLAQRLLDAAQTDWNLAQFDLARQNPWLARVAAAAASFWNTPAWRPARWALVALAVVQVLGLNAFAWRAQTQLEQQRSAIRNTLLATFPQVTVVVDAPLQMAREVAALRQASGMASPRDLETLLGALGTVGQPTLGTLAPTTVEFVAGELRLSGLHANPAQADALDEALQTQGIGSHLDGATLVLQTRSTP